jgi:hypothetical protein
MAGLGLSIPEVAARGRARLDPAAAALIGRMTSAPEVARVAAIDALVRALKAGGIWAKLDLLYLMAAHDEQAARRNWMGDAFNLAAVNVPGFVADRGFTGDGATSYLDTGFQPGVSAGAGGQDDNHLGVWCRTNASSAGFDIAATNHTLNANNAGNVNSRNMAGATDVVGGVATSVGHTLHSRSGGAGYAVYRNGAVLGTVVRASSAPAAASLFVCARNASGTPSSFGTRQIAAAHAGSALNATEAATMHAALSAYLTSVGAA